MSKCMFDDRHLEEASDGLRKALIKLFISDNITLAEFTEKHRKYHEDIGTPSKLVSSSRGNLIKLLYSDATITYSMFGMIVKNILGYNLINHTMIFKHIDGHEKTITVNTMTF